MRFAVWSVPQLSGRCHESRRVFLKCRILRLNLNLVCSGIDHASVLDCDISQLPQVWIIDQQQHPELGAPCYSAEAVSLGVMLPSLQTDSRKELFALTCFRDQGS